jgi:hypothetical protein
MVMVWPALKVEPVDGLEIDTELPAAALKYGEVPQLLEDCVSQTWTRYRPIDKDVGTYHEYEPVAYVELTMVDQ